MKKLFSRLAKTFLATTFSLTLLTLTASAATITVDTGSDDITDNANCTLREAIQAANTNTAVDTCAAGDNLTDIDGDGTMGDTIVFDVAVNTVTMSIAGTGENINQTGDFDISSDIAIDGQGANVVIDAATLDRHFEIATNGRHLLLTDLTLQNGQSSTTGGSVQLSQTISYFRASNVNFNNNNSTSYGGAIYLAGTSTTTGEGIIDGCTFDNNSAGSHGGAIYNIKQIDVTVSNSTFTNNDSTGGSGGAISQNSSYLINVSNNTFTSNTAVGFGGGIAIFNGTATVTNSSFTTNDVTNNGGAIGITGTGTISGSTFNGNTAGQSGGSIHIESSGNATVNTSSFTNNSAVTYGGAINVSSTNASFTGKNILFENNQGLIGGAINNNGSLKISLSTFDNNQATSNGGAIAAVNSLSTSTIRYSTFSNNQAAASNNALYAGTGTINIGGSIIDNRCSIGTGTITSDGYNVETENTCTLTGTGDLTNTDPLLAALNGSGYQRSRATSTSSPAIDIIPNHTACSLNDAEGNTVTTDQRGNTRPNSGGCDAGAVETDTRADLALTSTTTHDTPLYPGESATIELTLNNSAGDDTAKIITITNTLPSELEYVSASGTLGGTSCSNSGSTVTCTLNSLDTSTTETITITATVANGTEEGTYSNSATVTSVTAEMNAADNSTSVNIDVTKAPGGGGGVSVVVGAIGNRNTTTTTTETGTTDSNTNDNGTDNNGDSGNQDSSTSFTDTSDSFAKDAIEALYQMGVIKGYGDKEFRPAQNITRAEALKIILNTFKIEIEDTITHHSFDDVNGSDWFAPYVETAVELGYIEGYEDGGFHPNASITRAEFLKLVIEISELTYTNGSANFPDVESDAWYYEFVVIGYKLGIIHGYENGNFGPNDLITREQAAQIAYNAYMQM